VKAAEAFLDVLEATGSTRFFGLPGSTEASLLEAIRARQFPYVLALHEGIAVSMADGYARTSGRPGVVGLHTSVGTLNGLSQVMNAYRDGSPVVVTAGHKDRHVLSEGGFCSLPGLLQAAGAVTKWARQSLSADSVASDLAQAVRLATAPPPGPVYLAVPEDLLAGETESSQREAAEIVTAPPLFTCPAAESVGAAVDLLLAASRPVLVVGSSARDAGGAVEAISRVLGLPVLLSEFTDLSNIPVPTAGDRYLGLYGEDRSVLEGCDLVLAAGCRVFYPFSDASRPRLPKGAALVHLHDDPAEIGRVNRADVGLLGDVALALEALAREVGRRGGLEAGRLAAREEHLAGAAAARAEALRAEQSAAAGASPMRIEQVAEALADVLPEDAVLVDESVRSSRPLLRHLRVGSHQRLLRSSGGALGWGVPAAVGAKLGAPERPVVAVVGDGSFHFSVQAIWSAVQAEAPLVVAVLDNGGYLAVKRAIEGHLGTPHDRRMHPGTEIAGIDHVAVASGYGATGSTAADPEALRAALRDGLEGGKVSVVHVPVAQVRP
jgi:benzoylformate decarboxylase